MEKLTKANGSTSKSQLTINIEEMLRISEPSRASKACIYRVRYELRKLNHETYNPQVISIGPYHYGKERYKSMEKLKVECLKNFRRQAKLNVEELVNIIMKLEGSVRDCYAEDITFGRDDFAKIILVDASFIVEFLTMSESESVRLVDPWLRRTILRDLRKLENQLPFFVIEKLYNLVRASYGPECLSFTELSLISFVPKRNEILSATPNLEIKHFLDLLRTCLLPQPQRPQKRSSNEEDKLLERSTQSHEANNGNDQVKSSLGMIQWVRNQFHHESENLPSVTQLHRAGVKLKVSSGECLLKLEFKKGVLTIPKLWISDGTESYFRNIVAFEQRHYLCNSYVTNYITLLNSLIKNTEDVNLLVEKGIIVNWIGDNNAVTTLVNNLGKNLWRFEETRDYNLLSKDLKAFHNNRCHRWRAILVRDYFSTPWRIASTSAAVILLVLTFIQTVCSLIPFF